MNPTTLLSISTAKSSMPADGGPTVAELAQAGQWFTPGRTVGGVYRDGSVRGSSPRSTRSSKRPAWTLAECALACGGLDERFHTAVRFTYCLDDSVIYRLRAALRAHAERRSQVERWPSTVVTDSGRSPYLQGLVDLVLLEDRRPSLFLKPKDRVIGRPRIIQAVLLKVSTDCWRRTLQPKHEAIRDEYVAWLGVGTAHMRRALRHDA